MRKLVLFVGGGRRYELAKMFKSRDYIVVGYENSKLVPLADIADRVIVGKSFNDVDACVKDLQGFVEFLKPAFVLPLMDAAVPIVARLKAPVCSDLRAADICLDKKKFAEFMLESDYANSYPSVQFEFGKKYVEKPARGFGSRGVKILKFSEKSTVGSGYVYQNYIEGVEYSVDAYFNPYAEYVDSVIRTRERVADGEVVSSVVAENDIIETIVKGVGESLPIVGPCNMQFIVDKFGKPWIIEVNARFGGGWTFSAASGLDVISLLERDYLGREFYYLPDSKNKAFRLERSHRDHYF